MATDPDRTVNEMLVAVSSKAKIVSRRFPEHTRGGPQIPPQQSTPARQQYRVSQPTNTGTGQPLDIQSVLLDSAYQTGCTHSWAYNVTTSNLNK